MTSPTEMEARLWEYIDGMALPEERTVIEELIQTQQAWREKYQELLQVNQDIRQHLQLEEPSLRFTKNVMEEIARTQIAPATRNYINKKIIFGIAGFFLTLIFGFIIYALGQIDWSAGSSSSGFEWSRVDYSRVFNNQFVNVFMMINIVLGLMLFDRYLTEKKKNWSKES